MKTLIVIVILGSIAITQSAMVSRRAIEKRELLRTVTHEAGDTLHQHVDDQQGQVTDQFVSPAGIRNLVHRHGVLVLDQIVKTDGTSKQLVPPV